MRNVLCGMALVGLAGFASASVQIFYTGAHEGYGLTNPAMAFLPTEGEHSDITQGHYAVGAFPTPSDWHCIQSLDETVYVWLRFSGEPNSRKINGLDLDATSGNPEAAWYLLDDTAGDFGEKRWDGAYTPPYAPEFQTAHKVLVAATAYGLKNLNADSAGWMYSGGATRTYLLGALRFSEIHPEGYFPMLGIAGISYSGGYSAPNVECGTIHFCGPPEPAGVALLALLSALIRRR